MKNAMKKLMSLMLVAVLLVSAMPFAASADEAAPAVPTILLHVNGAEVNRVEGSVGSTASYADCLAVAGVDLSAVEVTDASWKKHGGEWAALTGGVILDEAAFYYVYIETAPKAAAPAPEETPAPEATPAVYNLSIDVNGVQKVLTSGTTTSYEECLASAGIDTSKVKVTEAVYQYTQADGRVPNFNFGPGDVITLTADTRVYFFTEAKTNSGSTNNTTNNGVVGEEWMKDIWLYIYVNNDIVQPAKRVLLNNYTIVNDYVLSKAEIMTVVDDYYAAANANTGIVWKGAYRETTNITALDFVAGRDETPITGLDVDRSLNTVVIKVRVTGVNAIGGGVADSSNPKTGDSIYTAMVVMGISAASLAAVMYFYNKKRMAI